MDFVIYTSYSILEETSELKVWIKKIWKNKLQKKNIHNQNL